MIPKHTPGPWTAHGCTIYSEDGYVAQTWDWDHQGLPTPTMEADAQLIAAAPAMLRSLQGILTIRPDYHAGKDDLWLNRGEVERIAKEAIAAVERPIK